MADTKISAGADPVTVVATDKVPMARSASTTAYAATMAELATYANGAYVPSYYAGTPSMDGTGAPGTAAFVSRGDHVHPSDTTKYAASNPSGYQTAAQVTAAVAPAFNGTGRNLLHNPLFNVAQRGGGPFTANASYTLDRWKMYFAGGSMSVTQAAQTDAGRAQIGDELSVSIFANAFVGTAGAGDVNFVVQPIEDVRRLSGKVVTVSFWAAGAAILKLGVSLDQVFGTTGASATVILNGQSVTLATTWQRYSLTFTLPSASGMTITAGNFTQLDFWFSAGSGSNTRSGNVGVQSGTIYLWGVQLEIGSVATPLEKPDPRYDLANCQRFFCVADGHAIINAAAAGAYLASPAVPQVAMRAAPTLTGPFQITAAPTNCGTITTDNITARGFRMVAQSVAAGIAAFDVTFQASADL